MLLAYIVKVQSKHIKIIKKNKTKTSSNQTGILERKKTKRKEEESNSPYFKAFR